VTGSVPVLVELSRPRALTEAEHALMVRLVTFADEPSLSERVATVRAVSTCDCGCASVGLRTEGPRVEAGHLVVVTYSVHGQRRSRGHLERWMADVRQRRADA
jgi:hypothetical protein